MIWIQLLFAVVLLFLIYLTARQRREYTVLLSKYRELMNSYPQGNLENVLLKMNQDISLQQKEIKALTQRIDNIEGRIPAHFSRVGMVRFKAFPDIGGDLSFALALLSDEGNGFVLTGIHGRNETQVYAKAIVEFAAEHQLSEEERQALKIARETR